MPTIYEVPLRMQEQRLDVTILEKMGLPVGETPSLGPWKEFLNRRYNATEKVRIALVGKYDLQDAYKSILEALSQAATYNDRKADIHFVNSGYQILPYTQCSYIRYLPWYAVYGYRICKKRTWLRRCKQP